MIVVDTNVLSYLLIEGNRTEVCQNVLRKDPEWCVPFLWRSEFRNVLTKCMQHAGMTLEGAKSRMNEAEKLLGGSEYFVSSDVILSLTAIHPVSAYDAEFIALASKLDTKLVTTNKPLQKKFPDITVSPENFL